MLQSGKRTRKLITLSRAEGEQTCKSPIGGRVPEPRDSDLGIYTYRRDCPYTTSIRNEPLLRIFLSLFLVFV